MNEFKPGDRVRATRKPLVVEGTVTLVTTGYGLNNPTVAVVEMGDVRTVDGEPVLSWNSFADEHFDFELLTLEPSMGSIVVDRDGDAWQRMYRDDDLDDGVWKMAGDEGAYTWERLSKTHGPLTVLRHGEA